MRSLILLALLLPTNAEEVKPDRDPAYKLVWSDEFTKEGRPDPNKWRFERGFMRNKELQWYQEDNAFCKNGRLVIEARREQVPNPHYRKGSRRWQNARQNANYTSASLITQPDHRWTYGRFEVRARLRTQTGLWPAIWTTGVGRWPHAGEIDIMEYYDHSILANVAWAGPGGRAKWDESKTPLKDFKDPEWEKKFHAWVMIWTPERIDLYLDGRRLNTTALKDTINEDGDRTSPFHAPQALRLNLALGGVHGGDLRNTEFPSQYEIDYVRVYQREH